MASNSISRKQLNRAIAKKKNAFKRELESIENPQTTAQNQNIELAKKENIADFYKKLTPLQRKALEKELELKKVRDNYALYLKYVYPDYKFTAFHALLANICQTVVKKVENGEKVRLCISCPPQHGKLVANNTPVLTRHGWKNHGDLVIGDEVINDKGDFVKITYVFPKYFANKKVYLTNGEEICVHENHEWFVYDRKLDKNRIVETKEIYNELEEHKNEKHIRGHRYRFQLPIKEFEKGEEKDLCVNPYVLGVWLGDGTNKKPDICAAPKDIITLNECRKYYSKGGIYIHKDTGVITMTYIGLRQDLNKYGMCKYEKTEKHIPQEYLTSSLRQRLELLAGLLDTDGYADLEHNRYVFTTADLQLKNSFEDLIATFGWRTTTSQVEPSVSTSGIVGRKVYWQIGFNPTIHIPCRIDRKKMFNFSKQRKIAFCKIEDIEHCEGNCIEVENSIYCVGRKMIPTHNSKTITETLPSWFIGRNPEMRAILTAYNSDIAEKFGNKNRQLIKDHGKEIFGLEVSDSQDNKTLWDLKGHNGGLYSAGILAGITSNTSQLTIIDDPYKNGEEANNPTIRERVYQTTADSVLTRSNGKGNAVIVIHTRWHDDDLIGRLQKLGWAVINIPCIWEDGVDKLLHRQIGQTLCPELGFDAEWALQMQQILGRRKWNALYQGKPYVDGGNIIKREDLRFYDKNTIPNDFEEYVLSCDLTFGGLAKTNDPYCMTLWGRNGGNHYLLKIYNKRAGFKDTANTIRIICGEYPRLRKKIVEKKANGWATIEMLGQEVGGFVPYDPKNLSKEDRLNNVSPYFEGGNVYFPSEDLEPNIENFITQLLRFPNTEHDDFVDTISQYLLNYEYRYGGKVNTDSSLSLLSKAIRGL